MAPPGAAPFGSSSVGFLLRQLGGAVGVGLVGILLESRLQAHGAGGTLRAYHEVFALMGGLALAAAWAARRMNSASPPPPI
ncbi:MAG: hypothetical protein IPP44_14630 [Ideonella sp.]|nr:hypothetical protein [Ideonella sp.]